MAAASAEEAFLLFPVARASKITAAITPARKTDGEGLTNNRKITKNAHVVSNWIINLLNINLLIHKTKALTIAKLAPLTAVR